MRREGSRRLAVVGRAARAAGAGKKRLAAFIQWEQDEGQLTPCCERATPEEIEENPELFDCENCELKRRRAEITPHDALTLEAYRMLRLGVVRDLKLQPLVFDILDLRMTRDDARLMVDKMARMYAIDLQHEAEVAEANRANGGRSSPPGERE